MSEQQQPWVTDYVDRAEAATAPTPPPKPKDRGHTGQTAKARAALDAGLTVDTAWGKANDVRLSHVGQLVRTNPDKYERVGFAAYRKRRNGRPPRKGATEAVMARLEAGHEVTWEWVDGQGFNRGTVHTIVSSQRKRGVLIENLPDKRGYRLRGPYQPKPPATTEPATPTVDVAHPPLGQHLTVWGVSLTDDGTLLVALRNGSHIWMTELVGGQQLETRPKSG